MKKIIIFWKPLVILMLSFMLTGFLCSDDKKDENSCSDAVTNAVNVYVNAYNNEELTLVDLCNEFQEDMTTEQYNQCIVASQEELDALKSEIINALSQDCADEDWPQSFIDCLAGASTIAAIEACVAAVQ